MFLERDLKIQKLISEGVLITAGGSDFFSKKISGAEGGGGRLFGTLKYLK